MSRPPGRFSGRSGPAMSFQPSRNQSSSVSTAITPGAVLAAEVSIDLILAWA